VEVKGSNLLVSRNPIMLYTQVMDKHLHNVVHMHVDDLSDHIRIDAVNLADLGKDPKEYYQLKKDVDGKELSYRVIVDKQKVECVLYPSGKEAKMAVFNEVAVPPIGAVIRLTDGRLATLQSIPQGLLVRRPEDALKPDIAASSPDAKGDPNLPVLLTCTAKHPVDLMGYVVISLLTDESRKQRVEEQRVYVPICSVQAANPADLEAWRALRDTSRQQFIQIMALAEAELRKEAAVMDFQKATAWNRQLNELIGILDKELENGKKDPSKGSVVTEKDMQEFKSQLQKLGRVMRAAAISRRS